MKKIHQLVPNFVPGDAISNYVLMADQVLKQKQAGGRIFYGTALGDRRSLGRPIGQAAGSIGSDDLVLYHLSDPSPLTDIFLGLPGRKIIIYHNRTPGDFFFGQNIARQEKSQADLVNLRDKVDLALGVSQYNTEQLRQLGFPRVAALPLVYDQVLTQIKPDKDILDKYADGGINLLFVGRIAPNKCQDDLLRLFSIFQKYFQPDSRLILVGKVYAEMQPYWQKLQKLERRLHVRNVVWTGQALPHQLTAYYRSASFFVCLSEHEGIGLPLLEAMSLGVPVLAFEAAAVAETLAGAGVLIKNKDFGALAGLIDRLAGDEQSRQKILAGQNERLKVLTPEKLTEQLLNLIDPSVH